MYLIPAMVSHIVQNGMKVVALKWPTKREGTVKS